GKKLFDGLLAATNRAPEALIQIGIALREVGAWPEARKLAEEAYRKENDPLKKQWAAYLRSLLYVDLEDAIVWLERTDTYQPQNKARLEMARGELAQQRGKEENATEHLREAIRLFASLPEDASSLNDGGLTHRALYRVTGEVEHLDRARTMHEKALALHPSESILVINVVNSVSDATYRAIIGKAIDLTALRQLGQSDFLAYLYADRKGRDDYAERVRKHPGVARLTGHANRLMLLAPKQPNSYVPLWGLYT